MVAKISEHQAQAQRWIAACKQSLRNCDHLKETIQRYPASDMVDDDSLWHQGDETTLDTQLFNQWSSTYGFSLT